jgi:hypothetical protein
LLIDLYDGAQRLREMKRQVRGPTGIPERASRATQAALATCLVLVLGCGGRDAPQPTDSIQLELDFGGGVTLTSVTYDLTGPNGFVERMGPLTVGSSDTVIGNFGSPPLPAGMGYDVKVNGTATDGVSTCTGEVVFNMPRPNVLQIPLTCTGIVSVSGTITVCPTIDSLEAVPSEVLVGSSIQLTLAAHDPDTAPAALTAAWSAPPGTLMNTSTTGATFTCTTAGSFVVSVSVDDGTPDMQCTDSASVNVVCTPSPGGM